MNDRFEQEFYRTRWQRVLPLGPDGVQPYVRTRRGPGLFAAASALRRLLARLAGWAPGAVAFWRPAAIGMALPQEGTARRAGCCP